MKAVILAGGYGTRLYPLSTKEHPKQFINLIGERTLFQQTIDRLSFLNKNDIFVATNKEYIHFIKEQAPEIPDENIFEEPSMRNTATCIAYAALKLSQKEDEVMAIIYADHLVRDTDEFARKLLSAEILAKEENTLNIIEVEAKFPSTKLGYVKIGNLIKEINGEKIYEFKSFKEKPDEETAKKYLESKDYLWNTGFYVWKIKTILEKYSKFLPQTLALLKNNEYDKCENISIDYAIMEKVDPKEVRILPAILGWSDIGTWESLFQELEKNKEFEKLEKFKKIHKDSLAINNK